MERTDQDINAPEIAPDEFLNEELRLLGCNLTSNQTRIRRSSEIIQTDEFRVEQNEETFQHSSQEDNGLTITTTTTSTTKVNSNLNSRSQNDLSDWLKRCFRKKRGSDSRIAKIFCYALYRTAFETNLISQPSFTKIMHDIFYTEKLGTKRKSDALNETRARIKLIRQADTDILFPKTNLSLQVIQSNVPSHQRLLYFPDLALRLSDLSEAVLNSNQSWDSERFASELLGSTSHAMIPSTTPQQHTSGSFSIYEESESTIVVVFDAPGFNSTKLQIIMLSDWELQISSRDPSIEESQFGQSKIIGGKLHRCTLNKTPIHIRLPTAVEPPAANRVRSWYGSICIQLEKKKRGTGYTIDTSYISSEPFY